MNSPTSTPPLVTDPLGTQAVKETGEAAAAEATAPEAVSLISTHTRPPDWVGALGAHIKANMDRPFAWGPHDCVTWSISCLAVTRSPEIKKSVGLRHRSLLGALKEMKKRGCESPQEAAAWLLGSPKPVTQAKFGDIVALDTQALGVDAGGGELGLSLGVCYGRHTFFVGEDGLVPFPTLQCNEAYNG